MASGEKKKHGAHGIPLENLDESPYIASQEAHTQCTGDITFMVLYNTEGVVSHVGSMDSGHYTALWLSSSSGCWHSFDDEVVGQVDTRVWGAPKYTLFFSHALLLDIDRGPSQRGATSAGLNT